MVSIILRAILIVIIRGTVANEAAVYDGHIFYTINYCTSTGPNTVPIEEAVNYLEWTLSVHNTVSGSEVIQKPTAMDGHTAIAISFDTCSTT